MTLALLSSVILPSGMLIVTLLLISRMRLSSMISLFALQSVLLASYAAVFAILHDERELVVMALLIVGIKAVLVPYLLRRLVVSTGASERLASYLRPTGLLFVGMLIIAGAMYGAYTMASFSTDFLIVGTAFSLIVLGMFSLIVRADMFGQAIGFLVMESGVFAFGLALTGGMPFLVEIGAFIDVLTLFVLVVLLARRAQEEHKSVMTDYLKELID
jgi:hydrogenase-4 component E